MGALTGDTDRLYLYIIKIKIKKAINSANGRLNKRYTNCVTKQIQ